VPVVEKSDAGLFHRRTTGIAVRFICSHTWFSEDLHGVGHPELPLGICMADIPPAGTILSAGAPMMSLLAESTSVDDLSKRIGQLSTDPIGQSGWSWETISGQLREFHNQWQKIVTSF
jgi:hypothetical protein